MNEAPPILQKIDFQDAPTWIRWSHDGTKLLHGYLRSTSVYIRSAKTGGRIARFHCWGPPSYAGWSHDDAYISVVEGGRVTIRDAKNGEIRRERHALITKFAVWNPHKHIIAMDHGDSVVMFDALTSTGMSSHLFGGLFVDAVWRDESTLLVGHGNTLTGMGVNGATFRIFSDAKDIRAIASDRGKVAIAIEDAVVVLGGEFDFELDGSSSVIALSISADASLLAILRLSGQLQLLNLRQLDLISFQTGASEHNSLAFSPTAATLALTSERSIILYDVSKLVWQTPAVRYTTAKIALVGDSGVGKSGLGWVLTHDKYKEHSSTHGEQFWVAERLSTTRADGTRCEAVVWDLAGQPDYRLIHSLFIDDADVALVVYDPTHHQEPLKGAEFWLRALHASKEKRCRTILVAGRVDRGTGVLPDDEIAAFAKTHGIAGGFIATSAKDGLGVDALTSRIAELIDWDSRPATVTIDTFKEIRDRVLALKEQQSPEVLWTLEQLQEWLQTKTGKTHALDDITTAVKHLSDHGYVRPLRSSTGGRFVLLSPDLLNNLAASIVLEARRNPKGLGALDERQLLGGAYTFPEIEKLTARDRELLLDAAATLFIERNVCFRETLGNATFLIFPSLINQNKPPLEDIPLVEGTAYSAIGATENVYPSLVVLLGYTNTFTRTNQWRNQAQYEMGHDQICGFRLADEREGQIDLVLYFGERAAFSTRQLFQGLFEKFLLTRSVDIQIFPPMQCTKCGYMQPRSEVVKRQREAAKQMFCSNCGGRIALPERILTVSSGTAVAEAVEGERRVASRRTQFETSITGLKAYLRDVKPDSSPSCFISYAWGDAAEERWVDRQLASDLRNAGVDVILDRWHNKPGANIARFIERIDRADFVLLVGTPRLKRKYDSTTSDPVVTAELKLINQRLMLREPQSEHVIPLLRKGRASTAFPPLVKSSVYVDFRDDGHYFARMFDLLLTLYQIPFDDEAMRDLRDTVAVRPA